MTITSTREQRRQLKRDNAKLSDKFEIVPSDQWPIPMPTTLRAVYRNSKFLVQVHKASNEGAELRLTINRSTVGDDGRWLDNITWDELQEIKRALGYGNAFAVEIYPPEYDLVNDANMRHLWIVNELQIGWKRDRRKV